MSKNIRIYIDLDNVLCDYQTAYNTARENNEYVIHPQSQYGFFRNLEPMGIAEVAFKILSKKFDVWILSAPSVKNPLSYSEKREWVEKYLGYAAAEKLILSPDKSLLIGDYLIDDIAKGRAKQNEFKGTQIVFGTEPYESWFQVLDYFKNKYQ